MRNKDGVRVVALEETWGVEEPPSVEETQVRPRIFLSPVGCTFYPGRTREPVKV